MEARYSMSRTTRRIELHHTLENLLGSRNVYFQPPGGTKLSYPCIVYRLNSAQDIHADDKIYSRMFSYTLTYITKDPDDSMRDLIDDLPYCRFNQFFISDNLNHYVYTIYA